MGRNFSTARNLTPSYIGGVRLRSSDCSARGLVRNGLGGIGLAARLIGLAGPGRLARLGGWGGCLAGLWAGWLCWGAGLATRLAEPPGLAALLGWLSVASNTLFAERTSQFRLGPSVGTPFCAKPYIWSCDFNSHHQATWHV